MKVGAFPGAGAKRSIRDVAGPVSDNEQKRPAPDKPDVKVLPQGFRWEELPIELLLQVVHLVDSKTFAHLLEVSKAFNQMVLSIGPIHPLSHLSLDGLISEIFAEQGALQDSLQARFACVQFRLRVPHPLDWLYERANRADVKRLKLIIDSEKGDDIDISLDHLLPELEKQVAGRAKSANAPPPTCELLLAVRSCNAPSVGTLQALKHLKITALSAPRGDWLPLLQHLPQLREISFLEQAMDKEVIAALASRTEPIPRMTLGYYKNNDADGELVAMLKSLQVKHIELWYPDSFPLEILNSCELESLRLVENFGDDLLKKVDQFLGGATVRRLILSDDFTWPRQISDMVDIADGVRLNQSLRALDVQIEPDRVTGETELLEAILEKSNIQSASLPYPQERQQYADRAMAARPDLRIRRTNKYPDKADERLNKICKAMEEARSKNQ